jgi:hypothetical protein
VRYRITLEHGRATNPHFADARICEGTPQEIGTEIGQLVTDVLIEHKDTDPNTFEPRFIIERLMKQ